MEKTRDEIVGELRAEIDKETEAWERRGAADAMEEIKRGERTPADILDWAQAYDPKHDEGAADGRYLECLIKEHPELEYEKYADAYVRGRCRAFFDLRESAAQGR